MPWWQFSLMLIGGGVVLLIGTVLLWLLRLVLMSLWRRLLKKDLRRHRGRRCKGRL